jgi:hypothetical protein
MVSGTFYIRDAAALNPCGGEHPILPMTYLRPEREHHPPAVP